MVRWSNVFHLVGEQSDLGEGHQARLSQWGCSIGLTAGVVKVYIIRVSSTLWHQSSSHGLVIQGQSNDSLLQAI